MSSEPTYPEEAAVGEAAATGGETLEVVMSAKETKKHSEAGQRGRGTRNFVAGAAVGVGSAALVAALLYANRSRRSDSRTESEPGPTRMLDDPQD